MKRPNNHEAAFSFCVGALYGFVFGLFQYQLVSPGFDARLLLQIVLINACFYGIAALLVRVVLKLLKHKPGPSLILSLLALVTLFLGIVAYYCPDFPYGTYSERVLVSFFLFVLSIVVLLSMHSFLQDKLRIVTWILLVGLLVSVYVLYEKVSYYDRVERDGGGAFDPARPNVILLVVDALRADHLSVYGYERQTSPVLNGIARQGVIFTHAFAQGPSTRLSTPSLFLSTYFHNHQSHLHPEAISLPRLLTENGYLTACFSANPYVSTGYGYADHFDDFYYLGSAGLFRTSLIKVLAITLVKLKLANFNGFYYASGREMLDLTMHWMQQNRNRNLFAYVHLMDVHAPYLPPASVLQEIQAQPRPALSPPQKEWRYSAADLFDRDKQMRDVNQDLYDAVVLNMDRILGRFIAQCETAGLLDNTIIIVTADHGEELLEHGDYFHQQKLFDENIHVPLIISGLNDELQGQKIANMVSHIDIAPTILDVCKLPQEKSFSGSSLLPLIEGRYGQWQNYVISEAATWEWLLVGVRTRKEKMITWITIKDKQTVKEVFFDLINDPKEHNPIEHESENKAFLRTLAARHIEAIESESGAEQPTKPELKTEEKQRLKALGYVD